jgi:hypothetical protein
LVLRDLDYPSAWIRGYLKSTFNQTKQSFYLKDHPMLVKEMLLKKFGTRKGAEKF